MNTLERLQEVSTQRRYVSPYVIAMVYVGLDEKTQALELLEKAVVDRDTKLPFIRTLPYCDALKADPRYTGLLRRIGLEP